MVAAALDPLAGQAADRVPMALVRPGPQAAVVVLAAMARLVLAALAGVLAVVGLVAAQAVVVAPPRPRNVVPPRPTPGARPPHPKRPGQSLSRRRSSSKTSPICSK